MLTKLQIVFGILAGLAIVVFFVAVITNAQVKQPGPVPDWLGLVVWGAVWADHGQLAGHDRHAGS